MSALILIPVILSTGCAHDFWKDVEGRVYDSVAEQISDYCKITTDDPLKSVLREEERIEMRREVRQRGENGPGPAPAWTVPEIGENTAYGKGPVMRIWCEGEEVPDIIWQDYVRIY